MFNGIKKHNFGVILADPPWRFKVRSRKSGLKKSADRHYPTMTQEELMTMPVADLAADHAVLLLWATWPMLDFARDVMKAWGFTYKTGGCWAKQSSTGKKWGFGTGYIFRSASEPYLLGTRGSPKAQSRSIRNLIVAPVGPHSRKPDELHNQIETLFPGPYIELFARRRRESWTTWGLDLGSVRS